MAMDGRLTRALAGEGTKQREIGERIRRLRVEKLRLDQAELAERLGVSHGTVSYWERGGNHKPANLRKLADYAGVSIEFLTNGNEPQIDPRIQDVTDAMLILDEDALEEYSRIFKDLLKIHTRLVADRRKKTP